MSENQLSAGVLSKNKLFEDVFDGKVPERVPRLVFGDNAFCLEYAGYDLRKEQYSLVKNLDAIDLATKDFDSDVVFGMFLRMPHLYKMLEAINFVMGTDGFIQHPEVQGLKDDEYDDFITDPIKTLWDKVLPRLYPALAKPGFEGQKALSKAFYTFFTSMGVMQQGFGKIAEKYDKSIYSMAPAASCTRHSFRPAALLLRHQHGYAPPSRKGRGCLQRTASCRDQGRLRAKRQPLCTNLYSSPYGAIYA